MKFNIYIVLFLSAFNVFSQNVEIKTIASKSKYLLIEFASVEKIILKVHNNTDAILVSYQNADNHNVPEINDANGTIHIKVATKTHRLEDVKKNKYRAGQPLFPTYIVEIPKDMFVQLYYEKGNFETANFQGTLDLHLDAGTVGIQQFEGKLSIKSFSGLIDCTLSSAMLNVNSTKGEIRTNFQDSRLKQTRNSLSGVYVNAKNVLKIKSIHAKVNLKSVLTQK